MLIGSAQLFFKLKMIYYEKYQCVINFG